MSLAVVESGCIENEDIDCVIAKSETMIRTMALVRRLSQIDSTVLITGESGTGKTMISKLLHKFSKRSDNPFVKVNCANIPENLLESDIFGHDRGSFTGAVKNHKGKFEQADGGILFFDEIGELPTTLQAKILTAIEDKSFQRVGGEKDVFCDVRIIAATNRNVEQMVEAGLFRSDLYYRLNVFRIHVPPLRNRRECIPHLSDFFVKKYNSIHKTNIKRISSKVHDIFNKHPWFGNVRELSNTIERAVVFEPSNTIRPESIGVLMEMFEMGESPSTESQNFSKIDEMEKHMIINALKSNSWSQRMAAEALNITPRVINYKIKKYGIRHKLWRKNS